MQARYYDPVAARFLSTDPIGYQDQFNLYAYVRNDPINKTDPTGEFTMLIGGIIGAGIETAKIARAGGNPFELGNAVKIAKAGVIGAVSGGVGGAVAKSVATAAGKTVLREVGKALGGNVGAAAEGALAGSVAGATQETLTQVSEGGINDPGAIGDAAIMGGVTGGAASTLGKSASNLAGGGKTPDYSTKDKFLGTTEKLGSDATSRIVGAATGVATEASVGITVNISKGCAETNECAND